MQWIFPVRRARYFSMICGQESFLIKEKKKKAGISQVSRKMRTGINPFWQIGQEEKRSWCEAEPIAVVEERKPVKIWKGALADYTPRGDVPEGLCGQTTPESGLEKRAVTFMIWREQCRNFSA